MATRRTPLFSDEGQLLPTDDSQMDGGGFGGGVLSPIDNYIPPATMGDLQTEAAQSSNPIQTMAPQPVSTATSGGGVSRDAALQQVQGIFSQYGQTMTPEDLADFNSRWLQSAEGAGYSGAGYGAPWSSILNDYAGYLNTRFNRPTASNGGVGGSADPYGTGQVGYAGQAPGGNVLGGLTLADLLAMLPPWQQDPNNNGSIDDLLRPPDYAQPMNSLDPEISAAYRDLLDDGFAEANTPVLDMLANLIDPQRIEARKNERTGLLRDKYALIEQGMLEDARGQLADRGLLSLPGIPQGEESGAISRIQQKIAPQFANELGNAMLEEDRMSMDDESRAIETLTGMNRDQTNAMLRAAEQAGTYEATIADIALRNLDLDMRWNQFLAQYDLDRETLQNQIEQGRWNMVLQLITQFQQLVHQSAQGYIGN